MAKYTIGLDYGTLSVRALLVDIETGEELAASVYEYPHGVMVESLPSGEKLPPDWALQHPVDYQDGLVSTVREVMAVSGVRPEDVIGLGVDFTGSTVLAVKADGTPLCCMEEFVHEPHAYVKLWKHHGGEEEARIIDQVAKERKEAWLAYYGGKVSSEWMLPKILETLRRCPRVYHAADRMIDAIDWIIWQMTGVETRSVCGAGYKAFYRHDTGYPSKEFLRALDEKAGTTEMEHLVEDKLDAPIKSIGETTGYLTEAMAERLGLCSGTPVGTGILDAHASVLGGGIAGADVFMIIMGTSSCHLLQSKREVAIPGICGVVKGGMLPGYYGYEAGQNCVGDLFAWVIKNCVPESYEQEAREKGISIHQLMEEKLTGYRAGSSGLLALDWFNGVRSPLMDFNLSGMVLGMNLQTKPEEIYLSMLEATAYGARMSMENFEQAGISVESIVVAGGIPAKNRMIVQLYADVCNRDIRISGTNQACALGSAILGIVAADPAVTGYRSVEEAAAKIGKQKDEVFHPNKDNAAVYDKLYQEYRRLLNYFGCGGNDVMKRLKALKYQE